MEKHEPPMTTREYAELSKEIIKAIQNEPRNAMLYEDLFWVVSEWYSTGYLEDEKQGRKGFAWLRDKAAKMIEYAADHPEDKAVDADYFADLQRRLLLFMARFDFDAYMLYMEIDREPDKRFYLPRRHYLTPMVTGYQMILEGKLKLLTISMPKRAGKSQTGINFCSMISGMHPNRSTLMEGTGDALVDSFYKGFLEYHLQPNEYKFLDIFPKAKLVGTNAETKTANLYQKSRFPTLMCRSIDARQVGLSEATNVLYLDDCVEGRAEAKNRARLDEKWEVISGDIVGRAIEGTPIVMVGTRYSLYDPIGRMQEEAKKQKWNWRAIEVPALSPRNDESNYEYVLGGKRIFTTQHFREQRSMLTAEQWESEFQQQPFESKGLIFPKEELNYFLELPKDIDPDTIIAVCDTSEGKGDATALVVGAIYGQEVYIIDLVFDYSPPASTQSECANCIIRNNVATVTFESNLAGTYYARDVEQIVKDRGYKCGFRTKRTITNKHTRIENAQPNILKYFYFKHPDKVKIGTQYADFMKEVTTYTHTGKAKHDDAPDSLSLLENEMRTSLLAKMEIVTRTW